MDAIERNAEKGNGKSSLWDNRRVRFASFIVPLVAAIAASGIIVMMRNHESPEFLLTMIWWSLLFPYGLLLPGIELIEGLGYCLGAYMQVSQAIQDNLLLLICLGWLVYLGISVTATLNRHRRVFKVLYVVFVILLLVNVGGCSSTSTKPGGF